MKLAPAGLGAEPKKIAILVGLLVMAGGTYYWMSRPEVPAGDNTTPARAVQAPVSPATPSSAATPAPISPSQRNATSSYGPRPAMRGGRVSSSGDDFRPTLKVPDGMDVSRIDPTLRQDLMAKVRNVSIEGGSRSLFEFYTPPPPPPPKVNPIKPDAAKMIAQAKQPEPPKGPPVPPPPPAIPLKFYGYSGAVRSNVRRAFFLDGEDIVQVAENDTIRNRYKIIRIGVSSAVVEDTVAKNQQTLPLAEEAQ